MVSSKNLENELPSDLSLQKLFVSSQKIISQKKCLAPLSWKQAKASRSTASKHWIWIWIWIWIKVLLVH
ncbi:hypothetical protein P8452_70102 [Trifolium repens]|nr:hypothetical protein P8452_70102 [Trifolium repens]